MEANDPATDPKIPFNYDITNFEEGKAKCKEALQDKFGLNKDGSPVFAMVSRMVGMKGFDLVQSIADGLVALAALDVHHSADAAGIVLELWVVQTKGGFLLCKVFHRLSHPYLKSSPVRHPPHFDKKEKAPRKGILYPCGTPLFR